MIALPELSALEERETAGVSQFSLRGIDTFRRSSGASEVGESLQLAAGDGTVAWAVYQFNGTSMFDVESVSISLDAEETGEYWLGLAEWNSAAWSLRGPFNASEILDLTVGGNYLSNLNRLYLAVICFGDQAKIDSAVLSGNYWPWSVIAATPQIGTPGAEVELDASASYDFDGEIVRYEWDLDDDGNFELDRGADPTATTWLPYPEGSIDVRLRITDDDGAAVPNSVTLTGLVSGPSEPVKIVPEAKTVYSLEIINGSPAILFEGPSGRVQYMRAQGPSGTNWSSPITIDQTASDYCRLAVIGGKPAVLIPRQSQAEMLYLGAVDEDGTEWKDPEIAVSGYFDYYPRLAEIDGRPAIAFGVGPQGLYYAQGLDAEGSSWGLPVSIDSRTVYGRSVSIASVDGLPAIGAVVEGGLKFIRAQDASGSDWNLPVNIAPSDGTFYSSLTVTDGKPILLGHTSEDFYYVRAKDSEGIEWNAPVAAIPDYEGSSARWGFASIGGLPTIVYADSNPAELYMAQATAADGSAWGITSLLLELSTVNDPSPVINEVLGELGLAYMDYSESTEALFYYRNSE